MGALGKKLRSLQGGRVAFMCPGCRERHAIPVRPAVPGWDYNGNPNAPTFQPSIKVSGKQVDRDENGKWSGEWVRGADGKPLDMCCHSFVTAGRIQYLDDSTHALAGQTVDLPDIEGDDE